MASHVYLSRAVPNRDTPGQAHRGRTPPAGEEYLIGRGTTRLVKHVGVRYRVLQYTAGDLSAKSPHQQW